MATVQENVERFGRDYAWDQGGDEWSEAWGGADMQWYGTFLPRLHCFLPADTILEIAPGFGRWTDYLKDLCRELTVVDLNANCIDYCKSRFSSSTNITYHVNDGKSLDMIPDESIARIVSFDSLVHVEADVIDAYLSQFPRILTASGIALIHHSNFAACLRGLPRVLLSIPKLRGALLRLGLLRDYTNRDHWRAKSVSADVFTEICKKHGLQCIGQEIINWTARKVFTDCISVVTKTGSPWCRKPTVLENKDFRAEIGRMRRLSALYGRASFGTTCSQ